MFYAGGGLLHSWTPSLQRKENLSVCGAMVKVLNCCLEIYAGLANATVIGTIIYNISFNLLSFLSVHVKMTLELNKQDLFF